MNKIRINMLSQATSVDGQGVGSAFLEQVALVKECDDIFDVEFVWIVKMSSGLVCE